MLLFLLLKEQLTHTRQAEPTFALAAFFLLFLQAALTNPCGSTAFGEQEGQPKLCW